eukprot:TRINITY_DN22710_c0_g1_i2.p1 TRINITY_DN22710_c0_g1~~TRINITY_DN22710_c0_g1_i2.p1  ORF type:complete len:204 (-),score=69.09 TRINITY_DN22710_c0_g1_i2:361-972(-)
MEPITDRRSSGKMSAAAEKKAMRHDLKMVHKLLLREREALDAILEAARQTIRDAQQKQEEAERKLRSLESSVASERATWASKETGFVTQIEELESDYEDVRGRASQYAQMLLMHKGRLVFNMLRGAKIAALTQFFHLWKDWIQDIMTMRAAEELHEMTQGVGGRSDTKAGDSSWEFDMEPELHDLDIQAWDIHSMAGQFGLTT